MDRKEEATREGRKDIKRECIKKLETVCEKKKGRRPGFFESGLLVFAPQVYISLLSL